jgi:geranylgeranyl pyrophosphate synthase
MIRAMEKADTSDHDIMLQLQKEPIAPSEKIDIIKGLYQRLGVDEELRSEAERYYHQALAHLDSVDVPLERKSKIARVAQALHVRQF